MRYFLLSTDRSPAFFCGRVKMEAEEFAYDDTPKGRFLILNDLKQEFPTGKLKAVSVRNQKSATGAAFPLLTLEAEDGTTYECAAWARDVKQCVLEFGGKPMSWGYVKIERGATRASIVPFEKLTAKVENVV